MSEWTRLPALRGRLQKHWDRGQLLLEQEIFPLRIALRGPRPAELGAQFQALRDWVQHWLEAERRHRLEVEWREVNSREIGRNRLPVAVRFPTREPALALIGRQREGREFEALRQRILVAFPALAPWIARRPLRVLEYAGEWDRLLAVLRWIADNPRPGIHLRQLEIPGVDTKFIEGRRALLAELLDQLLDRSRIRAESSRVGGFASRYGFRSKPTRIRFRLLDARLYLSGISDLEIPVQEFARLELPLAAVYITENEVNGLAFPDQPAAMVIFGLGYGLDALAEVSWLQSLPIHYWGDIDTHGFAMLDQLRSHFPQARSLLMDRATLLAHEDLWGREERPTRRVLSRLSPEELALYDDLCQHRLAENLRLEQERISFGCLREALSAHRDELP